VIEEAKGQLYKNYEILANSNHADVAKVTSRYTDSSLHGIISDVHFLAHCQFIVGTFTSQVIGRVKYLHLKLVKFFWNESRTMCDIYNVRFPAWRLNFGNLDPRMTNHNCTLSRQWTTTIISVVNWNRTKLQSWITSGNIQNRLKTVHIKIRSCFKEPTETVRVVKLTCWEATKSSWPAVTRMGSRETISMAGRGGETYAPTRWETTRRSRSGKFWPRSSIPGGAMMIRRKDSQVWYWDLFVMIYVSWFVKIKALFCWMFIRKTFLIYLPYMGIEGERGIL